jgi:hypothetical protein
MSTFQCPTCTNEYVDILDHIRKKHPTEPYTALELQPLGLTPCPICSTACKGEHGIKTHSAKIHGTIGSSRVSTLPRARIQAPQSPLLPPRIATFSPRLQNTSRFRPTPSAPQPSSSTEEPLGWTSATISRALEGFQRKRPARTPSPGIERHPTRQRIAPPSLHFNANGDLVPIDSAPGDPITSTEIPESPISIASTASSSLPDTPPRNPTRPSILAPFQRPSAHPAPNGTARTPTTAALAPKQAPTTARVPRLVPRLGSSAALAPLLVPSQRNTAPSAPQPQRSTTQETLAKAHQEATDPITSLPVMQTLLAYAKVPIPEHRLHAKQATIFAATTDRVAQDFIRHPREKTLLYLLLLPRILGLALQQGKLPIVLRAYPTTLPAPPEEDPTPRLLKPETPAEKALKLLEKGFLGRASRALLDPTPLAPATEDTINTLYSKHPIGPKNPFQRSSPRPCQTITIDTISSAIKSIGKEKAPGLSGWTRTLLDIVTTAPNAPMLQALRLLSDMIRQGTAPGSELLCASRLIGLQKPNGGVRPIAIGDLIYRTALKAILITAYRPNMLLPNQLGVNSPGGVEPALFLLQDAIEGPNKLGIQHIASLDLQNAFNTVDRRSIATAVAKYAPTLYKTAAWAYNSPSLLVTPDGSVLASAQGVRQGDPIAPLLFSLAIRPTLEALQQALPDAKLIAYLDDIYILSTGRNILAQARLVFKDSPVTLNNAKSTESHLGTLQQQGLKTLGSLIGPLEKRQSFLEEKTSALKQALEALKDLPKQHALLLLRGSIHYLLRHLLRQLNPSGLLTHWKTIDTLIQDAIITIASREIGQPDRLLQRALITIPVKEGGLGIPSHADLTKLYDIAYTQSLKTLQTITKRLLKPAPCPEEFTPKELLTEVTTKALERLAPRLSPAQQAARLENASYLGRQWLSTLP